MKTSANKYYATESNRLKEAFGATIAARRLEQRFEQREFSRVVGISNSHLRKIESGETSPTLTTIAKLAAALDTNATDLVDEACRRANRPKDIKQPSGAGIATSSSEAVRTI